MEVGSVRCRDIEHVVTRERKREMTKVENMSGWAVEWLGTFERSHDARLGQEFRLELVKTCLERLVRERWSDPSRKKTGLKLFGMMFEHPLVQDEELCGESCWVKAWSVFAQLLKEKKRYKKAVKVLIFAATYGPIRDPTCMVNLSAVFCEMKQFDKALPIAQDAVETCQVYEEHYSILPVALFNYAVILEGNRNYDRAVQTYEDAVRTARRFAPELVDQFSVAHCKATDVHNIRKSKMLSGGPSRQRHIHRKRKIAPLPQLKSMPATEEEDDFRVEVDETKGLKEAFLKRYRQTRRKKEAVASLLENMNQVKRIKRPVSFELELDDSTLYSYEKSPRCVTPLSGFSPSPLELYSPSFKSPCNKATDIKMQFMQQKKRQEEVHAFEQKHQTERTATIEKVLQHKLEMIVTSSNKDKVHKQLEVRMFMMEQQRKHKYELEAVIAKCLETRRAKYQVVREVLQQVKPIPAVHLEHRIDSTFQLEAPALLSPKMEPEEARPRPATITATSVVKPKPKYLWKPRTNLQMHALNILNQQLRKILWVPKSGVFGFKQMMDKLKKLSPTSLFELCTINGLPLTTINGSQRMNELIEKWNHQVVCSGEMGQQLTTENVSNYSMERWLKDHNYPFNLGTYQRKDMLSRDSEANYWFNLGLKWCYAYHHEHAIKCFEKALEIDPNNALCYFGIAYAHGPNYNVHQKNGYYIISQQDTGFPSQKVSYDSIMKAVELKPYTTDVGRALIDALRIRCVWPPNDFAELLLEPYSNAMRKVYQTFPHDPDIACMFAESLMQLDPWNLFDKHSGEPAPFVAELEEVLLKSLAITPEHPGLLHVIVHMMEMSHNPDAALPYADILRTAMPDAGHLLHMPSHIDVLVGHYKNGIDTSENAIQANYKYLEYSKKTGEEFSLYIGYIAHDFHMSIYCLMLAGREHEARAKGAALMSFVEESIARYPYRAIDLDMYHAVLYHVLVRFGCWEEILQQTFYKDEEAYCGTNAILHYARGLAFAALGNVEEAMKERDSFEQARNVESVFKRVMHNNIAKDIFPVHSEMLYGEILYRKGDFETAYQHLRRAVYLEDELNYDEPWGIMVPVRHALGALLLEQNQVVEAEQVFKRDLKRYPNNPWALVGLHNCLLKAQPRDESMIQDIKSQLDKAMELSDCSIKHSCACAGLKIRSVNNL